MRKKREGERKRGDRGIGERRVSAWTVAGGVGG